MIELDYQGYVPAILSSYRGILSEDLRPDHRTLAQAALPMLTVLGETDPLIPPEVGTLLSDINPDAQVEVVAGAGHGLPYTHAETVSRYLKAFLRSHVS